MRSLLAVPVLLLVVAAACSGETESSSPDAGADTGTTPPVDAGAIDASGGGADAAGEDAGPGLDAGPAMIDAGSSDSEGCVDGAGLPEGENTFTLEGRTRRYILRLPNGYTRERAWPVVFALHGNGGSAAYWDGTSGTRNIRAVLEDVAILVVAEAIDGQWRDYSMPESTWPARIESELLYFEEILTQLRTSLCVDNDEIFSMGFSGGGSFSGVLGCRRTDIRAIAVGGSVIYFDPDDCVGTPAAWITIGTEELVAGREAYRDWFRDRAMCDATSTATEPDPCVAYDNCAEGTPVHYCQHPDGHIWPAFGSAAMWSFFSQFVD